MWDWAFLPHGNHENVMKENQLPRNTGFRSLSQFLWRFMSCLCHDQCWNLRVWRLRREADGQYGGYWESCRTNLMMKYRSGNGKEGPAIFTFIKDFSINLCGFVIIIRLKRIKTTVGESGRSLLTTPNVNQEEAEHEETEEPERQQIVSHSLERLSPLHILQLFMS